MYKSMNNFYFIGVDVSKKKLDFCVMFENKVIHEEVVANHQGAVIALIRQLENDYGIDNAQMLVCAKHTGQYTYPLVCACESVECKLWLEHPSNIKYSSGVQRGKNDKIDARRIAIYAARFEDKVRYYERPEQEIERLKQLEAERSLYVVDLAKYKAQLTILPTTFSCRRWARMSLASSVRRSSRAFSTLSAAEAAKRKI